MLKLLTILNIDRPILKMNSVLYHSFLYKRLSVLTLNYLNCNIDENELDSISIVNLI